MMAESLPFSMDAPVPSWELEAWYEDLQEVLSSDVINRAGPPVGGEEQEFSGVDSSALLWSLEASNPLEPSGGEAAGNCELDPDLTAELLELLGEEPAGPTESDCSHSSPAQTGTDDDEGVSSSSQKRRRSGQPHGGKRQRGREREQENERRVAELTAHNQRLRQEIEQLSAEVEATRAALIQRMVNLKT